MCCWYHRASLIDRLVQIVVSVFKITGLREQKYIKDNYLEPVRDGLFYERVRTYNWKISPVLTNAFADK